MTVTINISSQNLKITAGNNGRIEKWASLPVDPGLIKDGLIIEPEVIGHQLNAWFEKERLPRRSVAVGLTGASYVYRLLRLPHLPSSRLREGIERATRKEINLDLSELYIDWDVVGYSGGEMEVFVAGIRRRSIESLVQSLSIAGIKASRVDLSPLALVRAAAQTDTLLVNFEPECFDISIISGGIPVTLHSVLPRNVGANLEDHIRQLTDELTRTVDFYNLTHKESGISQDASLILSGSLATGNQAAEYLNKTLGFTVQALQPVVAFPSDFPFAGYSVNLGLAQPVRSPKIRDISRGGDFRDTDVDLLRARKRYLAPTYSTRQLLVPACLALAAFLLIPVIIDVNQSKMRSAAMRLDLATSVHQLTQSRMALEKDDQLVKIIAALDEDTRKSKRDIELVAGRGDLNQLIAVITSELPSGAIYSGIACETKRIVIDGRAADRAAVISYSRTLEKTQIFTSVRIALIDETQPENASSGADFRLIIER